MNLEGLKYSLFLEDDFLKGILLLFQFFIFNFHSKLNFFVRGFPVPCPPSNFYCVLFSRNERKNSSKFDFCFVKEVTMKKFLQILLATCFEGSYRKEMVGNSSVSYGHKAKLVSGI